MGQATCDSLSNKKLCLTGNNDPSVERESFGNAWLFQVASVKSARRTFSLGKFVAWS